MSGRKAKLERRQRQQQQVPWRAPRPPRPKRPAFRSGDPPLDRVLFTLSAQAMRYAKGLRAEPTDDGGWQVWAVVGRDRRLGCCLCGALLDASRPLGDAKPPSLVWRPVGAGHPRIVLASCLACTPLVPEVRA